jgi:N4-gp56 family major capsid protein|tara:strand:- start:585 stop:1547 length:963 start_codon:yes stop_codon:yes gene_type:complete
MATVTISTEAELIEEYYNKVFLNELRANTVFAGWGLKSTHPRNQGELVHWLSIADFSASPALTEGTDPDETNLSAGDLTAALAQYGQTVKISDILQGTWVPQSMVEVMERLARAAALEIDTVIRDSNFTAGGSAQYGGTAVARNSIATDGTFDMDIAEVRESLNSLETLKAQPYPDGFYRGIINQDVKYDLQGDTANWQEILKHTESGMGDMRTFGNAASSGMGKGVVGRLFGVEFILSQQALKMVASGSANTDVYQSYIFGPEHYGVSEFEDIKTIIKNPSPVSTLDLYGTVGFKMAFATRELNSSRMIRVESGAVLGD